MKIPPVRFREHPAGVEAHPEGRDVPEAAML
jgi:hypothetical protein